MRVFKSTLFSSLKMKDQILTYDGNLELEELIDWIIVLNKYFDYEEVSANKQVKFVATRIRGHGALWWDGVQEERRRKNKVNIKSWIQMVTKLKGKFLPKDY